MNPLIALVDAGSIEAQYTRLTTLQSRLNQTMRDLADVYAAWKADPENRTLLRQLQGCAEACQHAYDEDGVCPAHYMVAYDLSNVVGAVSALVMQRQAEAEARQKQQAVIAQRQAEEQAQQDAQEKEEAEQLVAKLRRSGYEIVKQEVQA